MTQANEKYKGDALLQKTYTVDFLSKKRVENNGEVPQYYVEESHPPIIDKEMWEAVQLEMERRKVFAERYQIQKIDYATDEHPFAGRVICGCCGRAYGRKVWNSTDERLRRIIWRCNNKYAVKGEKGCNNTHIDDEILYKAFVNAFNAVVENIDYFMDKWKDKISSEDILKRVTARRFISIFQSAEAIPSFDVDMYFRFIEKILVYGDKLIISLLDGTEVECETS